MREERHDPLNQWIKLYGDHKWPHSLTPHKGHFLHLCFPQLMSLCSSPCCLHSKMPRADCTWEAAVLGAHIAMQNQSMALKASALFALRFYWPQWVTYQARSQWVRKCSLSAGADWRVPDLKHNLWCPFKFCLLNESSWLHYWGNSQKIRRKVAGKMIRYSREAHVWNEN